MTEAEDSITPFKMERAKEIRSLLIPLERIEPSLDTHYMVEGWLCQGGLSILYGDSNVGKTFVAVDLAMHVASGLPWRKCNVKAGRVVYIAAEGGGGFRNRIAAIRKAKPELVDGADFHLLASQLDLHGGGDAIALCQAMPEGQVDFVVVDTMARSMGTGDENSARDVSQFIANLDTIRRLSRAHVMVIHHSGKDTTRGARGSSALRAAVDTEIAVTEGQVTCTKQRDMERPAHMFFALRGVELGRDQDGVRVSSAVVVAADRLPKRPRSSNAKTEKAIRALSEALSLQGRMCIGEGFPQDRKIVEISKWREQCDAIGLTDAGARSDTKRKAFDRAKKRLLGDGHIEILEDQVWEASYDDQSEQ